MIRHSTTCFLLIAAFLLVAAPVAAQSGSASTRQLPPNSPFAGGVPQGQATAETVQLTVTDILQRALEHNLGVLLSEETLSHAGGARRVALSQLLPNVTGRLAESRRRDNLEAFGFSPSTFGLPRVIGPFNTFDARVYLSQSLIDLRATNETRAENHNVEAARFSYKSARDLVVLVAANAYLEALAADARAQSTRAQLDTSQALFTQAQDLKQGGIIAGIDVVRAEVRLNTDRQRVTASQNDLEKARLQLARIIGLPVGQPFVVSAQLPNVPVPDMSLEQALDQAYKARPDYLASLERVKAAEASRAAAFSEQLPSVRFNADYGAARPQGVGYGGHLHPGRVAQHSDLPGRAHAGANRASRFRSAPAPRGGRGHARADLLRRALRVPRSAGDQRAAAGRDALARPGEPGADTGARSVCRRHREQHRSDTGAAIGGERRRAVHRRNARLRRRQGGACAIARRR